MSRIQRRFGAFGARFPQGRKREAGLGTQPPARLLVDNIALSRDCYPLPRAEKLSVLVIRLPNSGRSAPGMGSGSES